jgi:hypothetical protein
MRKTLTLLLLLTAFVAIRGQTIHLETACAGMTWYIGLECTWVGTFGDCFTETISSGQNSLTQGFHQPEQQVFGIDEKYAGLHISTYPNPARDMITIDIAGIEADDQLMAQLIDLRGRVLRSSIITDGKNQVDTRDVPPGLFLLRLSDGQQLIKAVKISKIN